MLHEEERKAQRRFMDVVRKDMRVGRSGGWEEMETVDPL